MKFLVIALPYLFDCSRFIGYFALIYIFTSLILGVQLCMSKNDWQNKVLVSFIYLTILTAQLMVSEIVIFSGEQAGFIFEFKKFVAALLTIVPFFTLLAWTLYIRLKNASFRRFRMPRRNLTASIKTPCGLGLSFSCFDTSPTSSLARYSSHQS